MVRRWIWVPLIAACAAGCVAPKPESAARTAPESDSSPFAEFSPLEQAINANPYGRLGTKLAESPPPASPAGNLAAAPVAPLADPSAPRDPGTQPAGTAVEPLPALPEPAVLPIDRPEPAARPAFTGDRPPAAERPRLDPGPDLGSDPRPAPFAGQLPAEPRPRTEPAAPAVERPSEPAPPPLSALSPPPISAGLDAAADPSLLRASAPTPDRKTKRDELDIVGRPAARVGDDVITLHQLRAALQERLESIPPDQRSQLTPEDQRRAADAILSNLIDRTLIIQAAKRKLKEPKQIEMFYESIEKFWLEHEVPPLLKRYGAINVAELQAKMAERGRSYQALRDDFRQNTLAQEYMSLQMKEKLTVSLPEMYSWYDKHQQEYDRPAQVIWREIVVDFAKFPDRASARRKADEILARVARGEDFAKIARTESQGATAAEGGLWKTSPGSYAIPSVNDALARMPIHQLSPVIEAPGAYHIVVVEQRRNAGPARFDEVQDEVRAAVLEAKRRGAAEKFVASLREQALISTMFDAPSDPAAMRTSSGR